MRRRAAVLAMSVVAALGAALLTPVTSYAVSAPTAPYSAISIENPGNTGLPVEGAQVWDGSNSDITSSVQTIEAYGTAGNGQISLQVGPTTSGPLAVGHYDTSRSADATHAFFDVSVNSFGCSQAPGTLDVLEVSQSGGDFTSFAANYSVMCDNSGPYKGVIRYNSTIGYKVADVSATSLQFAQTYLAARGAEQTYTLTSLGSDPLTPGDAALSGTNADSFVITQDNCSGVALTYGQTCTVLVAPQPTELGDLSATLTVPDDSPVASHAVALAVTSVNPTYGLYYPVLSSRILDTRKGVGAAQHQVKGGSTVHLQVLGKGHVPGSGASAVVLNLTVTRTTSGGHISVYPGGKSLPNVSSINYTRGFTGANLVTVPIGSNGQVNLYNSSGSVDLIADVQGWYASSNSVSAAHGLGGSYQPLGDPFRLMDTRTDFGHHNPLPGGYETEVGVWFGGVTQQQTTALAVTVTATGVKAGGYVTAFSQTTDPTRTSTLNLRPGVTTANLAMVPTDPCTESWCDDGVHSVSVINVFNGSAQPVDILVDIDGFYADDAIGGGLRFHPLSSPVRIVDTRINRGTSRLGANTTHAVTAPASVTGPDTSAFASNLTVVSPTAGTYLTVWPSFSGLSRPTVSNLNAPKGVTVANGVNLAIGDSDVFDIYNHAGASDVLVDVAGTFEAFPPTTTPALRGNAQRLAQPQRPDRATGGALTAPRSRPLG